MGLMWGPLPRTTAVFSAVSGSSSCGSWQWPFGVTAAQRELPQRVRTCLCTPAELRAETSRSVSFPFIKGVWMYAPVAAQTSHEILRSPPWKREHPWWAPTHFHSLGCCAGDLHLHLWPRVWMGPHRLAVPCVSCLQMFLPFSGLQVSSEVRKNLCIQNFHALGCHVNLHVGHVCSMEVTKSKRMIPDSAVVSHAEHSCSHMCTRMQGDPAAGDACCRRWNQCGGQHAVHLHHRPVLHHHALLHALWRLPLLRRCPSAHVWWFLKASC